MEIGIKKEDLEKNAQILNSILADEFLLYVKTRNFHWNVKGPQFMGMHKFFESQYNEIEEVIDEVAERVRTLGMRPYSSMKEFLDNSKLKENIEEKDKNSMVKELLNDYETIIRELRNSIEEVSETKDHGTEGFIANLIEKHEKTAWMLRSSLE